MRFARFGITLERMQPHHIELVRQWRNKDFVLKGMRFRQHISRAAQIQWFEGLDLKANWYFVANSCGVPFAMFHIKDIDWVKRHGEAGGFVGDRGFVGRPEAARAILALMDFAFVVLQLTSLQAHYHPQLRRIALFNQQLGYQVDRLEPDGFACACVSADRYFNCAAAFRAAAQLQHGPAATICDPDESLETRLEELLKANSADFQLQL